MDRRPCHTTARRPSFTLIELLVVVAIIGVLMSLTAAAYFSTVSARKYKNTQATIQKLYTELQKQRKAVIDDARKETIPSLVLSQLAGNDPNRARVIWTKLHLQQQFPMSYAKAQHIGTYAGLNNYLNPDMTYTLTLGGKASASNSMTESAACLLMALTQKSRRGMMAAAGFLSASEQFDSDGDGVPEVVDAWGNPLFFFRWPNPPAGDPNYLKMTTAMAPANPPGWNPNPLAMFQDPEDPTGTLQAGGYSPATLQGYGIPTSNLYMIPMIVSAGPDSVNKQLLFGIAPPGSANGMQVTNMTEYTDNIYSDPNSTGP